MKIAWLVVVFFLTACSTSQLEQPDNRSDNSGNGEIEVDGDADSEGDSDGLPGDGDSESDSDSDNDSDSDSTGPGDGDSDFDPNEPSLTILESGPDGFLLRGTILKADEVLEFGEVLVIGEHIHCAALDCSEQLGSRNVTVIETTGIISPGLIDAHNHLPYNFLPPWMPSPESVFSNRYEWIDNASYRAHIAPYGDNRSTGTHFCPAGKWGEIRSLMHGTTTIQGQSMQQRCIMGGVRNADNSYHHLKHNHMRTTIASPRDITDSQAQNYIDSFEQPNNPATRFAVHMAEGHSGNNIEHEFESFAGRDHRNNRHQGISLLEWGTAVLIHSMTLNLSQLEEVALTNSFIVWSPSSNLALYGSTAPIEDILDFGIVTALGPDWTVSGAFDMLGEMRVAQRYGQEQEIEALTPKKIWEMSTVDSALTVGLHEFIGRIDEGMVADIAIFRRSDLDPYQSIINSRSEHIDLVMIGGEVYFGDISAASISRNEYCETYDACGHEKFVCVKEDFGAPDRMHETLEDIREQLIYILEGRTDAPPEQQYGRGDELLELVVCSVDF